MITTEKFLIKDPKIAYETNHKYLAIFGMLWITFLIMSTYTSLKTFMVFGLEFSVALIAYPVTYIFADIFTEVYGYKVTRKIVWTGFFCIITTSALGYLYSIIPSSPNFVNNEAFDLIFRSAPAVSVFLIL